MKLKYPENNWLNKKLKKLSRKRDSDKMKLIISEYIT